MAIKINFNAQHNPEKPTFVLATRNGKRYNGALLAENIIVSDKLNDISETTFKVRKYLNGQKNELWDNLTDFKLLWCREWNMFLEARVELDESNETIKTVYGTQLGIAELSNIKLYNIEINTELDISRDDYDPSYPTLLYRYGEHKEASLLDRLLEKAPHYSIKTVSSSLANEQRTFSFDDISIYDAFQQIATELGCLFIFHSGITNTGEIERAISVVDLQSYCHDCGYRGDFANICPKCSSANVNPGYGEDTTIFVTADELSDSIQYITDVDSVKNCFKLKAGDDLMTATIRNCNPNGSDYIWYISDVFKADMSQGLQDKLKSYDDKYDDYSLHHETRITTRSSYNDKVSHYKDYYNSTLCESCGYKSSNFSPHEPCPNCASVATIACEELHNIPEVIVGYPTLTNVYYDTLDFVQFLQSEMMPRAEDEESSPQQQLQLINSKLTTIAVQNINSASLSTIENAVINSIKTIINSTKYDVTVDGAIIEEITNTDEEGNTTIIQKTWQGNIRVEDKSEAQPSQTLSGKQIIVNDDYETFVKQKLDRALSGVDDKSISGLFKLETAVFATELEKYCLHRLESFASACQSCLDLLTEQGIAADNESDLYLNLYSPYYTKKQYIEIEISKRSADITTIQQTQKELEQLIQNIRDELNFEAHLGEFWHEFCSFRREDTYSNDNYISDGLDNNGLFNRAITFIEEAQKELYKSAELQHSISSSLKNLLVYEKFLPLVEHFQIGNWIRVQIDDNIYKLRLISYEIDYDNILYISVEFSDVMKTIDGLSDQQSILEQATSVSKSYESVKKQAKDGKDGKSVLDNWVYNGLSLTNMKIVGNADNQNITWDSHGLLCREYVPDTDSFDGKQLKIINKGLYLTDNNWETSRAGIGNFMFYNPITRQIEEAYGVIADTLVGNLILSAKVGIYNSNSNIVIDESGITITADTTNNDDEAILTKFQLQKKYLNEDGEEAISRMFYVDENGDLVLDGSLKINTGLENEDDKFLNDAFDDSRFDDRIENSVNNKYDSITGTIDERADAVLREALNELEKYKAEVGQYLTFGGDEGLTIGANANGIESSFKTTLDNRRLAFKENDITVAYISNSQLNILNAIVRNAFILGKVVFMPRQDSAGNPTGLSVVWNEDFVETLEKEYTITTQPTSQTVSVGETARFTCVSSESGQVYNWQISKDGGDTWEAYSSGSSILSYTTSTPDENGYLFRCYARYDDGQIVISDAATLTVVDTTALYIVTQPTSVSITEGEDATFFVQTNKASSAEHTFKWEYSLNGKSSWTTYSTVTVNSNQHQVTFTNVDGDMAGAYIRCQVTYNSGNTQETAMTNGNARIEMSITGGGATAPPTLTITKNLKDVVIQPGDTITFIGAADTPELNATITYTWMYTTDAMSSKWLDGGTGDTFSVQDNGGTVHGRKVKFIVSDGLNTLESNVAIITVQSTIVIESQPQAVTINEDETASFSVVANTDATSKSLSYDWQYKLSDTESWVSSGSLSTVSYTDNGGSLDGCLVKCVISDGINTVETREVSITVIHVTLKITKDLSDVTIAKNETAYTSISATSTVAGATLIYEWYGRYSGESAWTSYGVDEYNEFGLGDNNGNLDGFQVRCIVSDGTTSVESRIATFTVLDPSMITSITTQPTSATVNLLGTATFSIEATGQDLTYDWQYKKLASLSTVWSSLGSTKTVSKEIMDENYDMASVRCVVTGADGQSITSDTVYIYVNDANSSAITISTQPPSSLKLTRGESSTLSVVASGSGLKYQWQAKSMTQYTTSSEYSNISGATTNTYNATASTSTYVKSQYCRCVITDKSGNVRISSACQITYN